MSFLLDNDAVYLLTYFPSSVFTYFYMFYYFWLNQQFTGFELIAFVFSYITLLPLRASLMTKLFSLDDSLSILFSCDSKISSSTNALFYCPKLAPPSITSAFCENVTGLLDNLFLILRLWLSTIVSSLMTIKTCPVEKTLFMKLLSFEIGTQDISFYCTYLPSLLIWNTFTHIFLVSCSFCYKTNPIISCLSSFSVSYEVFFKFFSFL